MQSFCAAFSTPPSFGGVAPLRPGGTLLRLLGSLSYCSHAVSRCHDRATRSWMACAAPNWPDSGGRENWSFQIQKSHATSRQSRQTLSRPGLWGCTTKGTVPSDGPHTGQFRCPQSLAKHLPQNYRRTTWYYSGLQPLCIPPLTLSQPCPLPHSAWMVINSVWVTSSLHITYLCLLALGLPWHEG